LLLLGVNFPASPCIHGLNDPDALFWHFHKVHDKYI
jgi:hypothetical protein